MPPDSVDSLPGAIAAMPAGRWAVGVSGGADSVALLALLRTRSDLYLHVVHLDHQTRGEESTADAAFVEALAAKWGLPSTVVRRSEIEPHLSDPPGNPSSLFRALRLESFHQVTARHRLDGVLLAHHADDQAETVLGRLLRGSGYAGLAGMNRRTLIGGLQVVRPLLDVRRKALRKYLHSLPQNWREDPSNRSDDYQRNRIRRVLADRGALTATLLQLANACRSARRWSRNAAPILGAEFSAAQLAALPDVLARESARRWLEECGVSAGDLDRGPESATRLVAMARDAATPPRSDFPGKLSVRRRRGVILADAGK